ncbi:MAG: nucleotide sugar dehydrogenase, partial [Staphylococcus equorum]|nr:nucleotide sugar dehydrogenase [Staphylococcus equorum]
MERNIAVVGLGYVGLPVAVTFGNKHKVIGFDINESRIQELKNNYDRTNEVKEDKLKLTNIEYTSNAVDLKKADFIIVAVPTPIDKHNKPDLLPLLKASETVGRVITPDTIVVYESTVYPGATEEDCVPVLEKYSGLVCGKDFFVGYSPERINPGDKVHTFETITKVVSGQTPEVLEIVADVYSSVVTAGVHKASSIKVAEAAKVIENTQRDVNIALMNELAIIFDKLNIDTNEVLKASGTKWNFLNFKPGLVGGHCIGVDPYYLTHKAQEVGHHPEVILAGRRINDNMAKHIASNVIKELLKQGLEVQGASVNVLGITFKENCPDL